MSKTIDINTVEIPDVGDIAIYIDKNAVRNGLGQRIDFSKLVTQFNNQLRELILALREGKASGMVVFIPDFWHICYGDAVQLPKGEATQLWDAACLAHDICKSHCLQEPTNDHRTKLKSLYRIAAGSIFFF